MFQPVYTTWKRHQWAGFLSQQTIGQNSKQSVNPVEGGLSSAVSFTRQMPWKISLPVTETALWWNGPEWLQNPDQWPGNPVCETSTASEAEATVIRDVLCIAHTENMPKVFDQLLAKHGLRHTLRISVWIARFTHHYKSQEKRCGPLTTAEVDNILTWWIKRVQLWDSSMSHYQQKSASLNLQINAQGLAECKGRIQGRYPIYLPSDVQFTQKVSTNYIVKHYMVE